VRIGPKIRLPSTSYEERCAARERERLQNHGELPATPDPEQLQNHGDTQEQDRYWEESVRDYPK